MAKYILPSKLIVPTVTLSESEYLRLHKTIHDQQAEIQRLTRLLQEGVDQKISEIASETTAKFFNSPASEQVTKAYNNGLREGFDHGVNAITEIYTEHIGPLEDAGQQLNLCMTAIMALALMPDENEEYRRGVIEQAGGELTRWLGITRQRAAAAEPYIEGDIWSAVKLDPAIDMQAAIEQYRSTGNISAIRQLQDAPPIFTEMIIDRIIYDGMPDMEIDTAYLYRRVQECQAAGLKKYPRIHRVIVTELEQKRRRGEELELDENCALVRLTSTSDIPGGYLRKLMQRLNKSHAEVTARLAEIPGRTRLMRD